MNIKAKDLIALEKCEKRYQLDRLDVVTEKNKNYYISIAIKEIIKETLQSEDIFKIDYLKERLEELLPDEFFLPLVKKETIDEVSNQLERYISYVKGNNYKLVTTDVIQDINVNGELITVSADFIFENSTGIEIVKIKRKAPELSYQAKNLENMPRNNIELYLLYLMGKHLYPATNITASFHHMTGKNDKKEFNEVYDSKKGYNIISQDFAKIQNEMVEKSLLELIKKTKADTFCKTDKINNCKVCPYNNICNYNKKSNIKLEEIEKKKKAPENFDLTDSQRKAVLFNKGIARINAGAGSGKTTVVALRVVELILAGCDPKDILLITFTNKGANEMREKIAYWLKKEGIEKEANKLNITTFNAWGNDIVMENYEELGFTETPTLIDKVQKYDIIFELLEKNPKLDGFDYKNPVMDLRFAKGVVAKVNSLFDYIKAYNIKTPEQLINKKVEIKKAYNILDMYKQYNQILKEKNLIEYQDQINLLIELIENKSDLLNKYDYKHIIVDEFQDTDAVQIDIILFLANQPKFESLMVVGDDSQSIFGFRNTSQENILNFHQFFNKVKDIEIVENFRSTPEIVDLANALNDLNENKIDKKLVSGAMHGEKPSLISFNNENQEYEFIGEKIEELMKDYKPEDIAVIARTKNELFAMEEYLKEKNIPYVMDIPEPLINDTNVYIAKSIITFLDNPEITQGLFEFLFVITDGFKDMKEDEIKTLIKEETEETKKTLGAFGEEIKLDLFFAMLELIDDETLDKFVEELQEKNYNFEELKDYLYKFIEYEDGKTIEKDDNNYKAVTLTTAHTSKGKEFPVVFNTISKYKATDRTNKKQIEEERRTLFVSLTRAKKELFITYVAEEKNNFNKSYTEFPAELAKTGKCILKKGF